MELFGHKQWVKSLTHLHTLAPSSSSINRAGIHSPRANVSQIKHRNPAQDKSQSSSGKSPCTSLGHKKSPYLKQEEFGDMVTEKKTPLVGLCQLWMPLVHVQSTHASPCMPLSHPRAQQLPVTTPVPRPGGGRDGVALGPNLPHTASNSLGG